MTWYPVQRWSPHPNSEALWYNIYIFQNPCTVGKGGSNSVLLSLMSCVCVLICKLRSMLYAIELWAALCICLILHFLKIWILNETILWSLHQESNHGPKSVEGGYAYLVWFGLKSVFIWFDIRFYGLKISVFNTFISYYDSN